MILCKSDKITIDLRVSEIHTIRVNRMIMNDKKEKRENEKIYGSAVWFFGLYGAVSLRRRLQKQRG